MDRGHGLNESELSRNRDLGKRPIRKIERIARKINEKRQFSMNKRRENENAKTLQVLSSVWGKFQFFRLAGMYCFFNPSFRGCR